LDALTGITLFAKVVEHKNLSETARDMGLTPSAVSRQLAELERRLGARLINRTTRRLQVTEAGEVYYQHCVKILEDIEVAQLSVQRLQAAPRGSLRVTAPSSFGRLHIAPLLPEFLKAFPEISVDITMSDSVVDLLQSEVDIAIRITALKDSGFIARRIAPDHRVMVASPSYLERYGTPQTLQDLRGHNCLLYAFQKGTTSWKMRTEQGLEEVEVRGNLRTNSGEALRIAALAGVGIALQGTWRVGPDIRDGTLTQLFTGHAVSTSSLDTAVYAMYPHKHYLSPKVRVFLDFLVAHFDREHYWTDMPALS
jgi:DNA-binding transcriptional LysR family regulator